MTTAAQTKPQPAEAPAARKETILSGMQPTGSLHVGNLEGALRNWVQLQDKYHMFCCIVDWHSLTADYEDTSKLKPNIFEMAVDWLAAGLDPEKVAIFVQSEVKEHAELHLIFSMLITVPTLTRLPTYLEKKEQSRFVRIPRLSGTSGGGYLPVQRAQSAGRQGSGKAYLARQRSRQAVQ